VAAVTGGSSAAPITLGELTRIAPLSAADLQGLCEPGRRVAHVVLAEDFDRLRRSSPHSLVVLHDLAATGGWSLAAALHLAWERNLSGVVVPGRIFTPSGVALARRLTISLLAVDGDVVDIALALAAQVSAPAAARALRLAQCAERLAGACGLRGILAVLNSELADIPVALVAGDSVLAGRATALSQRPESVTVEIDVRGPGNQPWARLVALLTAAGAAEREQVGALLRLARPALQAAWAQTRLDSSMDAAREQAAFALLRRSVGEQGATRGDPRGGDRLDLPSHDSSDTRHDDRGADRTGPAAIDPAPLPWRAEDNEGPGAQAPSWVTELGWRVSGVNRAVWLSPVRPGPRPSAELNHLVRLAWQRGRSGWPLIPDGDGWLSWYGSVDGDDAAALARAVAAFRDLARAHGLVLGVGRPHPGVPGLLRSVTEARLAAHVARDGGAGTASWFEQVGASAALAWLPATDLARVAELCLGEVMVARDRDVLVRTVLAVLDCGGSLSQASQRLGVHRNTVLARVARARQLGLAFDDPSQRLAIHVICHSVVMLGPVAAAGPQPGESLDEDPA
jgi:hypothetical protein